MLLKIKRKRNEEPLDVLLSAMALPRIFRLAETVEEGSFKNISEAKKLKERIDRRIRPGSRPDTPVNDDSKRDKKTQDSKVSE
ncbi:hypothetical protein BC941DRAFT_348948 [Chlamydoabsidia padenii]|nr:hypothetical protein BC941DRAFT_348948 [Chlamydoabsidia padenii]